MYQCPTCSREIHILEAPVRRDGPLTPEAYAMNALNRDRMDDLRRTLSLAYYGTSLALLIIKLPALGEFIEAAARGAGVANSSAFSGGVVFSWFLGVIMNCVCLAYFIQSERVKKTLVN
jgi:hypothetical protein